VKRLSKKQLLLRELRYIGGILIGAVFFAIGYSWFLLPYNMAPGGVGGLSQIINRLTGIPNGISMILINVPLFVSSLMTDFMHLKVLARLGWVDLAKHTFVVGGHTIHAFLGPEDMILSAIAGSVLWDWVWA